MPLEYINKVIKLLKFKSAMNFAVFLVGNTIEKSPLNEISQ